MILYRMATPLSREPEPAFESRRALKAYHRTHLEWRKRDVETHEILEEETGVQKLTEVAK